MTRHDDAGARPGSSRARTAPAVSSQTHWDAPLYMTDPDFARAQRARYVSELDAAGTGMSRKTLLRVPKNRWAHLVTPAKEEAVRELLAEEQVIKQSTEAKRVMHQNKVRDELRESAGPAGRRSKRLVIKPRGPQPGVPSPRFGEQAAGPGLPRVQRAFDSYDPWPSTRPGHKPQPQPQFVCVARKLLAPSDVGNAS